MCEKTQRDTTNFLVSNMSAKLNTQQNFQGEVLSGYVMSLIKQTQENIRCGRQSRFHCSTHCGYQGELLPINLIKNKQKQQREIYVHRQIQSTNQRG